MSFTGAAVVKYIGAGLCRITGLSLASEAAGAVTGTIGLHESTLAPDVRLPESYQPRPEGDVTLQDSVAVRYVHVTTPGVTPVIVKTGDTIRDFSIEFSTLFAGELGGSTGDLEIYVAFHT